MRGVVREGDSHMGADGPMGGRTYAAGHTQQRKGNGRDGNGRDGNGRDENGRDENGNDIDT